MIRSPICKNNKYHSVRLDCIPALIGSGSKGSLDSHTLNMIFDMWNPQCLTGLYPGPFSPIYCLIYIIRVSMVPMIGLYNLLHELYNVHWGSLKVTRERWNPYHSTRRAEKDKIQSRQIIYTTQWFTVMLLTMSGNHSILNMYAKL